MFILIAYSCLNSNHLESVGMDFVHKYCSVGDCNWNIEISLAIFNLYYKLCKSPLHLIPMLLILRQNYCDIFNLWSNRTNLIFDQMFTFSNRLFDRTRCLRVLATLERLAPFKDASSGGERGNESIWVGNDDKTAHIDSCKTIWYDILNNSRS